MSFLDNVKSKLGALSGQQSNENYQEYDYDEYDSYEEGYADDYQDNQTGYDSYDASQDANYRSSLGTSRSSYQLDDHPPLITQSDVRAQGVAELQQSGRQSAYQRSSTLAGSERLGSSSLPRTTTAQYGSEPTELRGDTPEFYASRSGAVRARGTTGNFPAQSFRQLVVVRPATYADAEKVAEALKEGHAVAIDLRNTRPELAKRILDFSFGAASVLGGQVETPANRVYAISVGSALTPDELELLAARGVA